MATAETNKELKAQVQNLERALESSREVLRERDERINHLRNQISHLEEIKLIHTKYMDIMSITNNPFDAPFNLRQY